jgi:hypothetical protein
VDGIVGETRRLGTQYLLAAKPVVMTESGAKDFLPVPGAFRLVMP